MVIDTSAIVAIGAPSQPAEVASVVAFPASPYAVFITKHARMPCRGRQFRQHTYSLRSPQDRHQFAIIKRQASANIIRLWQGQTNAAAIGLIKLCHSIGAATQFPLPASSGPIPLLMTSSTTDWNHCKSDS